MCIGILLILFPRFILTMGSICSLDFSYCFTVFLKKRTGGFWGALWITCYMSFRLPHTAHLKPKWPNYLSNQNTRTQTARKSIASLITANKVFHVMKQDVTCSECRQRIPIGLKQVHSFTLGCLLCNPMGCHGDHMLWQANNGSEPKHQGPHQETVKYRE